MDAQGVAADVPPRRGARPTRRGTAVQASERRAQARQATGGGPPNGAGRGRGRKRAREPSPPPPPEPDEAEEEEQAEQQEGGVSGSGSEEHSDEDAGSDSEAAALEAVAALEAQLGQAAAVAAVAAAPQLSVRELALRILLELGLPQQRASQGLDEAEEEAKGESFTDPMAWAEHAQILLACRNEFEAERDELAAAMDVSLREEQQRKEQQKPLHERTDAEVWEEFCDSALLQQLARRASLASLLAPPLRQPLLDYLQLEKRCKKWYCVALHHFEGVAGQLATLLGDPATQDSHPSEQQGPAAGSGSVPEASGAPQAEASGAGSSRAGSAQAAALPNGRQLAAAQAASGRPCSAPPVSEDMAGVLAAELFERRGQVEEAVFSMPTGGDSAAVPALFADAVPEGAAVLDVVDVLSDSDEERGSSDQRQRRRQQGERQQQQQQQQQQQEEEEEEEDPRLQQDEGAAT